MLERFAEVREGLISRGRSHPGLLPLSNLSLRVSRLLAAVYSESDATVLPSEHIARHTSVEVPLYAEPLHDTTTHLLCERGQIRLGE